MFKFGHLPTHPIYQFESALLFNLIKARYLLGGIPLKALSQTVHAIVHVLYIE